MLGLDLREQLRYLLSLQYSREVFHDYLREVLCMCVCRLVVCMAGSTLVSLH